MGWMRWGWWGGLLFSGRAWSQDALDPIGRGCRRRTGAALAPRFPFSPVPGVGQEGRLSCFGCSVYSCPLICPRSCPSGQVWVAQLPALPLCRGHLAWGSGHILACGGSPGSRPRSCSNPTLPPSFLSSAPSTSCPPASPQLYLQARAPPEGDSDLATWLLTEPDVQKVPPSGRHHLSHARPWACTPWGSLFESFCSLQGEQADLCEAWWSLAMGLGPPRCLTGLPDPQPREPHRRDLCPAWC